MPLTNDVSNTLAWPPSAIGSVMFYISLFELRQWMGGGQGWMPPKTFFGTNFPPRGLFGHVISEQPVPNPFS